MRVNYSTVVFSYFVLFVFSPDSKAKIDLYNALGISILPFADGKRGCYQYICDRVSLVDRARLYWVQPQSDQASRGGEDCTYPIP